MCFNIEYNARLLPHWSQSSFEKVQRSFTKHIAGLRDLSYHERLQTLKIYSLQRRKERYCII